MKISFIIAVGDIEITVTDLDLGSHPEYWWETLKMAITTILEAMQSQR